MTQNKPLKLTPCLKIILPNQSYFEIDLKGIISLIFGRYTLSLILFYGDN